MLHSILIGLTPLVLAPVPQDRTPENPPDIGAELPDGGVDPALGIWTGRGVEAPDQPFRRSSSRVRTSRRFAPVGSAGSLTATRCPVSSLIAVRGMEDNHVLGISLVDGLAGTGDSGNAAKELLRNLMLTQNLQFDLEDLNSKNIAVVRVEANIPAGIKPGRRIDVRVSTIGDASSLQGGTLVFTELTDPSGTTVYATASGPVTVGGFSAGGTSATATRNHVTVGTLPGGGKVQSEVSTTIVSEHGFVYLDVRAAHDSFGNVVNVAEAVNEMYPEAAEVSPDGKSVRVLVPNDMPSAYHAAFVQSILRQEVLSQNVARVIINERSGVIVMGGDVRLQPGVITYGNLTVTIAETPETSQPGPFSGGTTTTLDRTTLNVEEDNNALVLTPGAVTLQEVVDVLNVLGTTPRDMITILQAMSEAGTLLAEIRRM